VVGGCKVLRKDARQLYSKGASQYFTQKRRCSQDLQREPSQNQQLLLAPQCMNITMIMCRRTLASHSTEEPRGVPSLPQWRYVQTCDALTTTSPTKTPNAYEEAPNFLQATLRLRQRAEWRFPNSFTRLSPDGYPPCKRPGNASRF
jgi:hypothetical protein